MLMHDQSISYDYLILATGARESYFGHNYWEKFVPGLKSVVQAPAIRREILIAFERVEMEKIQRSARHITSGDVIHPR